MTCTSCTWRTVCGRASYPRPWLPLPGTPPCCTPGRGAQTGVSSPSSAMCSLCHASISCVNLNSQYFFWRGVVHFIIVINRYMGAIINLSVQASHRHRNSWKSHFLPQKVYKSAIWNESSVEWTLVDLDFAFVNDFQFWGCPTATKMTYFELHNKRLLLVYSWQFQDSLWKTLFLSEQIICINFLLIWFRSAWSINLISVAVGQLLKPLI